MTHSRAAQVTLFSRQLATMVAAGLPLPQAIGIIAEQTEPGRFRDTLTTVKDDVVAGASFPEALAKHPGTFDPLYANMVKCGDIGGNLDVILDRLANHLEAAQAAKRAIRNRVLLPFTGAAASAAAGLWLVAQYAAVLVAHLAAAGRTIPAATAACLGVMAWIWFNAVPLLGLLVLLVAAVVSMVAFAGTSKLAGGLLLRCPLAGRRVRALVVARFSRILATTLSSGVPILDGLEIVAKSIGNRIIEDTVMDLRKKIKEGTGLSGPLKESGIFPAMVIQMMAAGEETGKLDQMLFKIADFYDAEVEASLTWPLARTVSLAAGISLLVAGLTLVLFVAPLAG